MPGQHVSDEFLTYLFERNAHRATRWKRKSLLGAEPGDDATDHRRP